MSIPISPSTAPASSSRSFGCPQMGWGIALILTVWLSLIALRPLWEAWQSDARYSHGPLIVFLGLGLLWMRREHLRDAWDTASRSGLALFLTTTLLYLGAVWADIAFLKPFSLLGMMAGGIQFLGGTRALKAAAGVLGLLVFALPWPTTLVEAVGFPLQLTSSAYAALFAGILGLPIQREGVHIHVLSEAGGKPIYSIFVAQQCSGLTSVMVLLALGYLIACFTPTRWWARVALVAAVVPMALFTNALRLTIILLAGAYHSAALAQWVHDHEQPVLVFLCTLGLLGLRQALLYWHRPVPVADRDAAVTANADDSAVTADEAEAREASDAIA